MTTELILVSHDRAFLDNVVTSSLVMEGEGKVGDYVGGYTDWLWQRPAAAKAVVSVPRLTPEVAKTPTTPAAAAPSAPARRKLGFKEQRELEQLPGRISDLETRIATMTALMHEPDFYKQGAAAVTAKNLEFTALQSELDAAYARWSELE